LIAGLYDQQQFPVIRRFKTKGNAKMERRMKRLEWMNWILSGGLVLAVLPWIFGAGGNAPELVEGTKGKFQTISATQILLVDEDGKQVGLLSGQKKGSNFTMSDGNGKDRVLIGMSEGNPSLIFANKDGNIVARYAEKNGAFEISH
jgi:hypothetical protein